MSALPSGGAPAAGSPTRLWFPYWRPKPDARARLFCFPFAGGSASVFQRWAQAGLASADVIAVQYPGRETRIREPLCRHVPELVQALGPVLRPLLDRPFAFLGYSLGTYVALELAHWLQQEAAPAPLGLMLAAGASPHQMQGRKLYTLRDGELLAELGKYGGTPPQVLEDRELMEVLLPVLRADFEMAEEYRRRMEPGLSLPFNVWGGQEDTSPSPQALEGWREYTTGPCTLQVLPGGHFFMFSSSGDVLRESVQRTLQQWSAQGG
ncbi:thioesterase II family protein [Hyalangium versicolor]|uniref:thioesterase II family protein n=1 Tax=Hyalangium versicolor TaxID=2861190 RepID=UPI001CCA6430|nr:thioesterase domain-containing protein [Hyalangium versicolor]